MNSKKILGVRLDIVTWNQASEKAEDLLNGYGQHMIFTPNPEIVLTAQKDKEFKRILNKASLSICDGKGLQMAMNKLPGSKLKERVTGVDFMVEVCRLAEDNDKSVFLLGAARGVAEEAAYKLQNQFPTLKVAGTYSGSDKPTETKKAIEYINQTKPDVLFVAFGAPKQEKWINNNLKKIKSVKIAMGIGGSFDFIAGRINRAPRIMRKLGLEWVYRLLQQPLVRYKRIWKAVIVFPLKFTKNHKGIDKTK